MKKKFIALVTALLLVLSMSMFACDNEPSVTPGAAPAIFGNLKIANTFMTVWDANQAYIRLSFPGATGTLATLAGTETFTNKTLTSPTLTTPTIASISTATSGTVTITAGNYTMVGENLTQVLTNKTLNSANISGTIVGAATYTSPTINTATIGTGANITSPNILGTSVVANRSSGNATLSSGNVTVSHGFAGVPLVVLVTSVEVGATNLYVTSINATGFDVRSSNASASNVIYWLAILANE